jgi:hypothetical protein
MKLGNGFLRWLKSLCDSITLSHSRSLRPSLTPSHSATHADSGRPWLHHTQPLTLTQNVPDPCTLTYSLPDFPKRAQSLFGSLIWSLPDPLNRPVPDFFILRPSVTPLFHNSLVLARSPLYSALALLPYPCTVTDFHPSNYSHHLPHLFLPHSHRDKRELTCHAMMAYLFFILNEVFWGER